MSSKFVFLHLLDKLGLCLISLARTLHTQVNDPNLDSLKHFQAVPTILWAVLAGQNCQPFLLVMPKGITLGFCWGAGGSCLCFAGEGGLIFFFFRGNERGKRSVEFNILE